MRVLLLVAIGGGLGSAARYKLSGWILHHAVQWQFPIATFVVNAIGCLAIGLLAGLVERRDLFSPDIRIFLFAGLLGGFTTFSAFGLETFLLLRRGEALIAAGNVFSSVLCGFLALWLGFLASSR